jgi:hypothetical protein
MTQVGHDSLTGEAAMRDLTALREGWDTFDLEETRMLRAMTIQESLDQQLMLQRTWESQFQQTAALFGPERWAALAEIQERLRRLAAWQEQHGRPLHGDSGTTKPPE